MDDALYDVKEMVMREMGEIAKEGLNENSLHCLDKLVDILKDVTEIEEKDGYSMEGRGGSYARRRRYSNNSYRGYSRDDIMARMEQMKNNSGSEVERQVIQRLMNNMM